MNRIDDEKNSRTVNFSTKILTLATAISLMGIVATMGFGENLTATAAKPIDVIDLSNGYPSGYHHNLNVHGEDPTKTIDCTPDPDGNSVWVANADDPNTTDVEENMENTIQYFSNSKKNNRHSDYAVTDKCAEAFDGDPARVRIPYDSEGYYVYARVPGNHQNTGGTSSVTMIPDPNIVACDLDSDPNNNFKDLEHCDENNDPDLILLGFVSAGGVWDYNTQSETFEEVDNSLNVKGGKGKGKSKGTDITGLFEWSGLLCHDATIAEALLVLDANGDGVIDAQDIDPLLFDAYDVDNNGVISGIEFNAYLKDIFDTGVLAGLCEFKTFQWVLTVADLVVVDHNIQADDIKLWKLRFYPKATTIIA